MIFKESEKVRLIKAYREIFSSDEGLEILHDLCKSCSVYTSTFDGNPHEMAFKEGARSVVLRIMRTIDIDPFELQKMINKQNDL
jgi:hypothetical protein